MNEVEVIHLNRRVYAFMDDAMTCLTSHRRNIDYPEI